MTQQPDADRELQVIEPGTEVLFTAAQLRSQAPLLRLERVRAGDVLLTCADNPRAKLTAFGSDGLYSHAAIDPADISPSRLIWDSRLVPAPEQPVIWPDDLDETWYGRGWMPPGGRNPSRKTMLPIQVRQREALGRISQAIDTFHVELQAGAAERRNAARTLTLERSRQIESQAFPAEPTHPTVIQTSGARLLARSAALQRLEFAIADLESDPANMSTIREQLALREYATALSTELSYQGLRRKALASLYSLRRLPKGRKACRVIAARWRRHRRDHFDHLFRALGWPVTREALAARIEPELRPNLAEFFARLDAEAGGDWDRPWMR